ncbi:DUF4367 domain-containing protein [Pelotomaculum propionicicum]|uniref:DUF4367 domain-containing protein n=1 Tax=Pelotomaculum propionicicum TaxID=258475 RepID=A0A4Y7RQV5_9FIRM|nr:DUF4367 domain-containing protein [Pelotomaculum propionicicum]TEB11196.1 hypothetical protein Pmgp_01893 [Pelotomaculum propionicicum]
MPNNSSEQTRKKLYEEYEDSLFKLVMHDAAEKEGQLFLEEKEKLKNDPEFLPSKEATQKFSQQLDAQLKKSKAYARRRRIWQALNIAAVAMLIMLVILGTTVATVEAVRVRVLNFLMDIQQEYTSFQLKDSSSGSEGSSTTIDWHKAYVPTYIPDGYEVSAISNSEPLKRIEFKNPQGVLITYMELSEGNKPALDTENASAFEPVSINGHEGSLIVKNSLVTVIWAMNDRMFMIRGQMEKDTAVKMAEGVKYID